MLVKYTWLHPEGHEVTDEGLFKFTNDIEATIRASDPIFLHENTKLISVKVINPFIHEHDYLKTGKFGDRVYFECSHCKVVSFRRFSLFCGPVGEFQQDQQHPVRAKNFNVCRSPLKEMPPSTKLF